ncbi:MAG: hypothetical protein ACTJFR_00750 [Canibacter sp.]
MRRQFIPAAAAAVLLGIGLTGCGSQANEAAESCNAPLSAGVVSDNIDVGSSFGEKPDSVSLPKEASFSHSEATLVNAPSESEANGPRAQAGDLATIDITVIDGQTDETVYQSKGYDAKTGSDFVPIPKLEKDTPVSLGTALTCATAGERYAIAFTAEDSLGFAQSFGTTPGSPVVAIIDVKDVARVADGGSTHALPNGFPAVTTDNDGTPGVVLPPSEAPTEPRVAERMSGTGDKIEAENSVVVQVLQVNWDGTMPSGNSWEAGPQLLAPEGDQAPAWRTELTGLKTGSLAVVLEPKTDQAPAQVLVVKLLAAG